MVVGLQPTFPQVRSLRLGITRGIRYQPQEACAPAGSGHLVPGS